MTFHNISFTPAQCSPEGDDQVRDAQGSQIDGDFLRWLARPVEEVPERAERAPEEFDALLADIKARGRELRKSISGSTMGELAGSPDVIVTHSGGETSRDLLTAFAIGFQSVLKDFVAHREEWLVPRTTTKWRWAQLRDVYDVVLPLRRAEMDSDAELLPVDKDRALYQLKLKWASSLGARREGNALALEAVRRPQELRSRSAIEHLSMALDSLTSTAVIRGDLHTENILVPAEGTVNERLLVLVDFGTTPSVFDASQTPRALLALQQLRAKRDRSAKREAYRRAVKKERAGLRPQRRGTRVPPRAAPPAPAAVVVVDGSKVAEHLRPVNDEAACLYLALPQRLSPARDHLPQVREFWHQTLNEHLRGIEKPQPAVR
ncbi:hypothetical protein ABZ726_01560 [Streptomyces hundungensis]|uniref:hypothetical protein n=1 Tax=Streptomyces hundungensis TaxID=1077946 RepID=UPI0033CBE509